MNSNELHYSFSKLRRGRSFDFWGGENDGRPYTTTGFIIWILISFATFPIALKIFLSGYW